MAMHRGSRRRARIRALRKEMLSAMKKAKGNSACFCLYLQYQLVYNECRH